MLQMTLDLIRKRDELANKYWKDNKDYHDSDGVDCFEVFQEGFNAAEPLIRADERDRILKMMCKAIMHPPRQDSYPLFTTEQVMWLEKELDQEQSKGCGK